MPKKIDEIVKGNLEGNSFQKKPKLENKLKQKEIADGKKAELILRETNDAKMFESIFQKTANENFELEAGGKMGEHTRKHYERLTDEAADKCKLSNNLAIWAKSVQNFWYDKCEEDFSKAMLFSWTFTTNQNRASHKA